MSSRSLLAVVMALLAAALWIFIKETYLALLVETVVERLAAAVGIERAAMVSAVAPYLMALAIVGLAATIAYKVGVRDRTSGPVLKVDARRAFDTVLKDEKWLENNTETDPEKRQHLRYDYLRVRLANEIHNALAQGELDAWGEINLPHGTGPVAPIPKEKWQEIVIVFGDPGEPMRNMAIKRTGGHMAYVDVQFPAAQFARRFGIRTKALDAPSK